MNLGLKVSLNKPGTETNPLSSLPVASEKLRPWMWRIEQGLPELRGAEGGQEEGPRYSWAGGAALLGCGPGGPRGNRDLASVTG